MKFAVPAVVATLLLIGCGSGPSGSAPEAPPTCNCTPPPFKPLPREQQDQFLKLIEEHQLLMAEMVPKSQIDLEGGATMIGGDITENCYFERSGSQVKDIVIQTIQAKPKRGKICPIDFIDQYELNVNSEKGITQGTHTTRLQVSGDRGEGSLVVQKLNFKGPYVFTRAKSESGETVTLQTAQDGEIHLRDHGAGSMILKQDESKTIERLARGEKKLVEIQSARMMALLLKDVNVVFEWKMSLKKASETAVITCTINGVDVSGTHLCQQVF